MLAVVPARGGSRGLPGKNIRPLAGLPLIVHSLRCSAMTQVIDRTVVSTDSDEIASVARLHGADVPWLRPAELAADDTPMMPVLQHALREVEEAEGHAYASVLLLDPTSPCRLPSDLEAAAERLAADPTAVGAVAVSEPTFNPLWVGVVERDGHLARAPGAEHRDRRQDAPRFLRVNGAFYLWRSAFLRSAPTAWLDAGPHVGVEIPEGRAYSIDDEREFHQLEALIAADVVELPWLLQPGAPA